MRAAIRSAALPLLLWALTAHAAVEPTVDDRGFHYLALKAEDFMCTNGGWKEVWQGYGGGNTRVSAKRNRSKTVLVEKSHAMVLKDVYIL